MRNKLITVVDDDEVILHLVGKILRPKAVHIELFSRPKLFLESLQHNRPDLVITDLMMPEMNGLQMHEKAMAVDSTLQFMMLTTEAKIETALDALRLGFVDYVFKPIDPDEFGERVVRALDQGSRADASRHGFAYMQSKYNMGNFIAHSANARMLREEIRKGVVHPGTHYWFVGEIGTGKHTAAYTLHYNSIASADAPLVEYDCSEKSPEELQSDIFGQKKIFANNVTTFKLGLLHRAHGGTLIIKSPELLPKDLSAALFDFMETGMVLTAGKERKVSVRLIFISRAGSMEDIFSNTAKSPFLQYWKKKALFCEPLSRRSEDIVPLAEYFLSGATRELGATLSFDESAITKLGALTWRRNILELERGIRYFASIATGTTLSSREIISSHVGNTTGISPDQGKYFAVPQGLTMRSVQGEYVRLTLEENQFNLEKTAQSLGVTRKTLWEVRKKYDL